MTRNTKTEKKQLDYSEKKCNACKTILYCVVDIPFRKFLKLNLKRVHIIVAYVTMTYNNNIQYYR